LFHWQNYGVEGHFKGENAWIDYHLLTKKYLSTLTGASPDEVVAMNSLTVNLHLAMVSFYRPTPERYQIICEAGAFPSDQYAIASQISFHGFSPENAMIEITPDAGEQLISTAKIVETIRKNNNKIALVLLGGVNYATGQVFDIRTITAEAHAVGAYVGFDLAHAIGNIPLQLSEDGVDFAVWCSYKYLNSSPGGVGGMFVHIKHADTENTIPRFAGWWGHHRKERFLMKKQFEPMYGVDGWQLSNAPILPLAVHHAALSLFDKAGFENLLTKSRRLTGYLRSLLSPFAHQIEIITPLQHSGCQLSLRFKANGKQIFEYLLSEGVIVDWREPDIMRVAPVPLYNSFADVYRFVEILKTKLR
jgi:kynureninase